LYFVIFLLIISIASLFSYKYLKTKDAFNPIVLVSSIYKPTFSQNPRVGVFYNVWWNNPGHDSTVADDVWGKTTLTPLDGYYTSKNSYFVEHIKKMKDVGIDFAVVSYHLYDRERFLTFSQYADKLGLYYAPMVESNDALNGEEYRPMAPNGSEMLGYKINKVSANQMATEIISSIVDVKNNKGLLRIGNKPVIFVYDGHFYFPSWDKDSKLLLARYVYEKYQLINPANPFSAISTAWGQKILSLDDIVKYYPSDMQTFNNANKRTYLKSNDDFRQAFIALYTNYWKDIRKVVEEKVGPIYLISTYQTPLPIKEDAILQPSDLEALSVFDDEFYYSLSNTWSYWKDIKSPQDIMSIWANQETDQATRDKNNVNPAFLTVTPAYNDTKVRGILGFEIPPIINEKNTYDITWDDVIKNKADYVLIATWNEFFEGTAIQPSAEYGNSDLNLTKIWIDKFKRSIL